MRNSRSQRWDRGAYVLHEKGDLTKQYGAFVWNDFTMDFRELPDVLEHEHPLLFHALGNLISCQFHQCSKWPGPYEQSGFSKDKSRSFFSVATLQRRAAEMLGSRFRLTPQ